MTDTDQHLVSPGRGRSLFPARGRVSLAAAGSATRSAGAGLWRSVRREPLLWLMVLLTAAVFSVYALVQYAHFGDGYDMGIFDQTVWHYAHFQIPSSSLKPLPNILADHFSPILVLLVPLLWIWDNAQTLLLTQAVLLAVAAVPIFAVVRDRLGRAAAYLLTASYLLFWGLQSAVNSDFHELAFAPLLMALVLLAIERKRWRSYWVWLFLLLCVKEDFSLFAIFLGLYLMTLGQWRRGAVTFVLGVVWYAVVIGWLMPSLDPTGVYVHWMYPALGKNAPSAVLKVITHPGLVFSTLFGNATKRSTLEYTFVPFLCLCLCSRMVLLLIPLVAERFLSDFTHLWTVYYHYSLQIAAVLVIGSAYGIENLLWLARRIKLPLNRRAEGAVVLGLAAAVLGLNVAYARGFAVWESIPHRWFYKGPPYAPGAAQAVAIVPAGASVATQDTLVPHLAGREVDAEITARTGKTQYIAANVLANYLAGLNGGLAGISRYIDRFAAHDTPVGYFNGWLVLQSDTVRHGAHRTRALGIDSPAGGRRLWAAYKTWLPSTTGFYFALQSCAQRPSTCYAGVGGRFRAANRELDVTLSAIRPELTSGCRQLLVPAQGNAAAVANALWRVRSAGLAGNAQGVKIIDRAIYHLVHDEDALGALFRFATFCHVTV